MPAGTLAAEHADRLQVPTGRLVGSNAESRRKMHTHFFRVVCVTSAKVCGRLGDILRCPPLVRVILWATEVAIAYVRVLYIITKIHQYDLSETL